MKKVNSILGVIFIGLSFNAVASQDCPFVLASALTLDHKKEVEICLYSEAGNNFVRYRFGKVGKKPELELIKPASKVDFGEVSEDSFWSSDVEIKNGYYTYTFTDTLSDENGRETVLRAHKQDREIALIKLDSDTVGYSRIEGGVYQYGLIDISDVTGMPSITTRVAPELTQ